MPPGSSAAGRCSTSSRCSPYALATTDAAVVAPGTWPAGGRRLDTLTARTTSTGPGKESSDPRDRESRGQVARRGRRNPFSSEPLPDDLKPASVNEWIPVFRRVVADPFVKNVGIFAATYADPDGTNIFPGNARIANVTGLSDRAVRDAFRIIREFGLMHRCSKGSSAGRRGMADEYRLSIPLDIFTRVPLLTPEEDYPDEGRPALIACELPGTAELAAGDSCG